MLPLILIAGVGAYLLLAKKEEKIPVTPKLLTALAVNMSRSYSFSEKEIREILEEARKYEYVESFEDLVDKISPKISEVSRREFRWQ